MRLTHTRVLPAPPGRVFDLLSDPPALAEGVDGLQPLVPAGPDAWNVVVQSGFVTVKGTLRLAERQPASLVAFQIDAKGAGGKANGRLDFRLAPRGDGTAVDGTAEVEVGGLLALAGARRLETAGQKALADFFDVLAAKC